MRPASAFDPETMRRALVMGDGPAPKLTPARARVLELMKDGLARAPSEIASLAGVTASVAAGLAKTGALKWIGLPEFAPFPKPDATYGRVELRPDQARASHGLVAAVQADIFSTTLLDGVTGSARPRPISRRWPKRSRAGGRLLIMLPEIALTVQFLDRFAARFGCRPAEWHSDLAMRERRRVYRAVRAGDARVVMGARSALFLPFPELGLIVVDEEHEQAYKQEEGVIYHARDMAVVRARIENCPLVLSSATPSLETYVNAQGGRYGWLKLARRHGAEMAEVRLVDMRENRDPGQFLSWPLRGALEDTLAQGEQALLFLNRRGYAPLTLCAACGHKGRVPQLFGLAGRTPLSQAAGVPSLRIRDRGDREVSAMRGGKFLHRLRTGRRTRRRGISRRVSRCARGGRVVRHAGRPRRNAGRDPRHERRPDRRSHWHPDRGQGSPFSATDASRRHRCRPSAGTRAIRVPPSAVSSCCIRCRGVRGAANGRGWC